MATEVYSGSQETKKSEPTRSLFSGRLGRELRENIIAYLFLTPALLVIFTFGIFPLLFAAYVSLYKWRIKQNEYRGLGNYVTAMGDLAYAFFFTIAIALIIIGVQNAYKAYKDSREHDIPIYFAAISLIPSGIIAFGMAWIVLRFITFFAQEKAIAAGEARVIGNIPIGFAAIVIGVILSVMLSRIQHSRFAKTRHSVLPNFSVPALITILSVGIGLIIATFTYTELQASETYSETVGHIRQFFISVLPLILGYFLWTWGSRQSNNGRLSVAMLAAVALMAVGVYLLFTDWGDITAGSSDDFYLSMLVTVFYSVFTVPFQLGIAMILAYLLYQNIRAKGLFRIVFFIPYIAPTVATAGIFQAMFTRRDTGLANTIVGLFSGMPLKWLKEADTVLNAFGESFGIESLATLELTGPSLSLLVIILFNIWVYIGYDTVIFLAGLGNIPNTLYEAAKIDGAGRWDIFRNITFPLLSPTTYFLSVISIIGTFKAFNGIWVLRQPEAQGTADTASVYFFETFLRQSRFGYATAMAMVLFVIILVLYIIQNRIAAKRVFYG